MYVANSVAELADSRRGAGVRSFRLSCHIAGESTDIGNDVISPQLDDHVNTQGVVPSVQ